MISASPTSALMASVMLRKSSTSYDGAPSGRRAWMCTITPPSSTIRRASAAYSSGVYGIAGHWSRLASDPEIEQVMTTGSSRLTWRPLREVGSPTPHCGTGPRHATRRGAGERPLPFRRRPGLALLDLAADLAGRVLLGVDVHVGLAALDRLDGRGEVRHAGGLGELLGRQLAALGQAAWLGADGDDHRAGRPGLPEVDVGGLGRTGQLRGLQRVADRLAVGGDLERRRSGRLRVALRRLGLAVHRRLEAAARCSERGYGHDGADRDDDREELAHERDLQR